MSEQDAYERYARLAKAVITYLRGLPDELTDEQREKAIEFIEKAEEAFHTITD